MSGDRLKHVKAVKSWIDKAEDSYTKKKYAFGEFNLIMAQAEMQRLKETGNSDFLLKRYVRVAAVFSACILIFGGYSVYNAVTAEKVSQQEIHMKKEAVEMEILQATEVSCSAQEDETVGVTEEVPVMVSHEAIAPEPKVNKSIQEVSETSVSISQQEIQSAVGEAGRILRGQYK